MAQKGTESFNDYVNDYERTMQDYTEMGPLWAEMVFGDDFEAMKAMYGQSGREDYSRPSSNSSQNSQGVKRR